MGFSLKLAVVSATVLSTAVMLKLVAPVIMELTISDLPFIWTSVISWLKPPYLYVVINCIIITIVASSRLQSKLDDSPSPSMSSTLPTALLLSTEPVKVELPPLEPPFHGGQLANEPVKITAASYGDSPMFVQAPEPVGIPDQFTDEYKDEDMKVATEAYEEITNNKINKHVISMSSWTPSNIKQVDLTFPVEKPPASARFSHRKLAKGSAEGGRTLGIAKPKRQDTLETTWKTITEGRSVPLTRHLRKSDTWETHRNSEDSPIEHHPERMTKSDTFDVNRGGGSSRKPPPLPSKLSRSGGSGRLRKDPSLGQEELNRKVEAFIKKFNEDMRLQRQESLNQYMEMINRGAH
ncbi:uncharacterized protein LOC111904855 [Lactuca sativa]|uniref:DUF4408 domain-containing protein n=1 Tax=Lactuca sativa TaxID=4236 RepID=A0A9R1X3R4_LACSA|nr:uncharacterized protein LOC111904855 [Lactuca sativa]KAJ0195002.1 hypothetical protein LSAT_V11C700383970 [Lactuca sativa]